MNPLASHRNRCAGGLAVLLCMGLFGGCSDDEGGSSGNGTGGHGGTTQVGRFEGLFDDVVTGYNFPLDIAIVPDFRPGYGGGGMGAGGTGGVEVGDILAANYGTSEVLLARDPSGPVGSRQGQPFYDGTAAGFSGTMGVAMAPAPDHNIWVAFEQGGDGDDGGLVVLSPTGERLVTFDNSTEADAFANPGGICYGGHDWTPPEPYVDVPRFFFINMGDGTAWRIDATNMAGDGATFTRVGSGLATGRTGNPGSPGSPITTSTDLPEGGARGCAYHLGRLYVADAQNQRVVRFDGVDEGQDVAAVTMKDTPENLLTYPTGVTVNLEGNLIVISYDNAHAFVALVLPDGAFVDNGLYDLNVNAGNHGVQVAHDTIWFTRANNRNGALRAITADQQHPPSTAGEFPVQ